MHDPHLPSSVTDYAVCQDGCAPPSFSHQGETLSLLSYWHYTGKLQHCRCSGLDPVAAELPWRKLRLQRALVASARFELAYALGKSAVLPLDDKAKKPRCFGSNAAKRPSRMTRMQQALGLAGNGVLEENPVTYVQVQRRTHV